MLRNVVADIAVITPLPAGFERRDENVRSTSSAQPVVEEAGDDSATYLLELLIAARRVAVTRRYRFLAYLIGMAAEEARLLIQGRSAVPRNQAKG